MSQVTLSLTNFLYKLVITLLVLWVAHLIDARLLFSMPIAFSTAVTVSLFGIFEDAFLLPQVTTSTALSVDFIITAFIIFFVPFLWHGTQMTVTVAILCALVITFFEITLHAFLRNVETLLHRGR